MNYDCSVTRKKGCNYCRRYKTLENESRETNAQMVGDYFQIDGENKTLEHFVQNQDTATLNINYCPICGRKL